MKYPLRQASAVITVALAISTVALAPSLRAQPNQGDNMPMHGQAGTMPMQGMDGPGGSAMPMAGRHARPRGGVPAMAGQDAFGAIQEIVRILEADPKTDWSKVDLEALRQHLIDMNEVTLHADVATKPVEGGIAVTVTGSGRTLGAIQRMVPAHASEVDAKHFDGWNAKTEPLADGVLLTVTATDPKEVQHIRGLGFIGIMVSGEHHQPHHLAMARGQSMH